MDATSSTCRTAAGAWISGNRRWLDGWEGSGEPRRPRKGSASAVGVFSRRCLGLRIHGEGRVSNVWRVPILSDRPATWADAVQLTSERAFIEFVDASPERRAACRELGPAR